jgi:hypothetical protein
MQASQFQQLFSEKLKSLGYSYNHNIVAGTDLEKKTMLFFDSKLRPSKKYATPYVREYDYRVTITKDSAALDDIVTTYDMQAYRAEMYELILNQTLNSAILNKQISVKDSKRNYPPSRVFVKG